MPNPPLSISDIVDITVTIAPPAASPNQFNQGLAIGPSPVIPSYGANARIRQYNAQSFATAMLNDGFTSDDPEYIEMQTYFDATPQPISGFVGRQDLTAIKTAVSDGRFVTDGAITASAANLSSATADFVSGDIGKTVVIPGAGVAGANLITTIASITSTTVAVVTDDAATTVSAANVAIGPLGTGYVVGDLVAVTQMGASHGVLSVLTIGPSGTVRTLGTTVGNQGTGYATATGLATTSTGSGTGLEVNITAIGESLLQAAEACRLASGDWYGLMVTNPVDADNLALAEWADPLWQSTKYYPWSDDADIANGVANNLADQLKELSLRCEGIYSTTQDGLFPNNIYAAAGLMGCEMGLNTGLPGSYWISAHKVIPGIASEPISETQYANIKASGFNVVGNFQGKFQILEPGKLSNGAQSSLWTFLAMLVANMQIDVMNVLTSLPVVPQTNAGEQLLIQACNQACQLMADIGFVASGVWKGATIPVPTAASPAIVNGQALPAGYVNVAPPYSTQAPSDRDAGKAMPIVSAILAAGGTLSVSIGVQVQQ